MNSTLRFSRKPFCLATFAVALLIAAPFAYAGFFSKVVKIAKSALSFPGRVVGTVAGGFIGAATAPTINHVESAGNNLIREANKALEQRIGDLDEVAKKRLEQMDSILQRRIGQVDVVMQERINQVDTVLALRTTQLDTMLEERIAQIDRVAETRIGNLDVVATKAALTLEESILRVVSVGCIMIFLSVAVWMIYREAVKLGPVAGAATGWWAQFRALLRAMWPKVGGRLMLTATAAVALWSVFAFLPGGARHRRDLLTASHLRALNERVTSFDFNGVTFHAAQLKAIDSTDPRLTGLRLKAELVRDIFSRPTMAQNQTGFVGLLERVGEIERLLGRDKDPDLQTIKGVLLWRTAANKLFEHYAASCFASALKLGGNREFALAPLAVSYLDVYLDAPISPWALNGLDQSSIHVAEWRSGAADVFGAESTAYNVDQIAAVAAQARRRGAPPQANPSATDDILGHVNIPAPLRPFLAYNLEVKKLRRDTGRKYLEMLTAFSEGPTSRAKVAAAATDLARHWAEFEERLLGDPALSATPSLHVAPLLLNDALEGRAAMYLASTAAATDIPAQILSQPGRLLRVRLQPQLRRFLQDAPTAFKLVNSQETVRYQAFEQQAWQFEKAFIDLRKLKTQSNVPSEKVIGNALNAAIGAAALGLYSYDDKGARPLAEKILADANIEEATLRGLFKNEFLTLLGTLQSRQLGIL